ncbi:MAG: hypothetical protein WC262_09680 [Bacteroidales bacterium]|jgi:hypothetical protein
MRRPLFTILLLAIALIATASAATVTVSDVTFQRDSTGTATITLTGADTGLSGYSLTASVSGTAAQISQVSFPAWAVIHSAGDLPASSVALDAVDLNNAVTGSSATLATLTLSGISPGTGTISVTVSSMDDDAGQPITPTTDNGTYSVTIAPGGTDYPLCDGLTISAANITAQAVTLSGTTPYPEVWIVLGAAPGKYGYQSSIITTNTSDYSATIVSLPLIAGQTYYARAGTDGGYSPEISFSLPALTPAPVTTHGDIFSTLMAGNLSIEDFWTAEADLYARPFGGGGFGAMVFISLLSAIVFVVLFLRSGDVIVPFMVGALVGGLLIPYLLPQFAEIGYACMVAAMIGIGYSLYRRYL